MPGRAGSGVSLGSGVNILMHFLYENANAIIALMIVLQIK